MFILVDDEDRENEGDLIIPAQMATPEAVNFMAKYGRGLICLALTRERAETLELKPMTQNNRARNATAFTTSIEAREGITTGISAHDRSRTITVAIDAEKSADDIVSPGHVFPLIAKPGGVLIRAGHTEAAVDISRLAGLNPSGVICEIMNEDGTMARMDDLIQFARLHGMKIGTIRDLIAYRSQNDELLELSAETRFTRKTQKEWRALTFYDSTTDSENMALVCGKVDPDTPTLVRMHALNIFNDYLGADSSREGLLERSMDVIEAEGSGVVVVLNPRGPGRLSEVLEAYNDKRKPKSAEKVRDYGTGANILTNLSVQDMILLTDSPQVLVALDGYGLSIVGHRSIKA